MALGDRTRSSIVSMFTVIADGFLDRANPRTLLHAPQYPAGRDAIAGKIIFVDLPVEVYNEVGVCAQMVWKHCWQRATARREPDQGWRHYQLSFGDDEAQFFCSSGRICSFRRQHGASARAPFISRRICRPTSGEPEGQDRTNDMLLGNLQSQDLPLRMADHVTNTWAADTIARGITEAGPVRTSRSGGGTSFGDERGGRLCRTAGRVSASAQRRSGKRQSRRCLCLPAGPCVAEHGRGVSSRTTFKQPSTQAVKP